MRRRRVLLGAALGAASLGAQAHALEIGGARIDLRFDAAFDAALVDDALTWAQRAGAAVAGYLGRLPLQRFDALIEAVDGVGVAGGRTLPAPQPHLRIRVGTHTRAAHFADDWILVHEMLHLALPQLPPRHGWLHEGVATYAEGAARVHAGQQSASRWWGELVRGLPRGLPQPGDRGLDHTATWSTTYWGGALYCLLADLRMRRSDAQRGLRDALQGVLAAGGSYAVAWPIERVLAAGDAAVGQRALSEQYEAMKDRPLMVDLPTLWRSLGVDASEQAPARPARLDDSAPLAAVRRAIAA